MATNLLRPATSTNAENRAIKPGSLHPHHAMAAHLQHIADTRHPGCTLNDASDHGPHHKDEHNHRNQVPRTGTDELPQQGTPEDKGNEIPTCSRPLLDFVTHQDTFNKE